MHYIAVAVNIHTCVHVLCIHLLQAVAKALVDRVTDEQMDKVT